MALCSIKNKKIKKADYKQPQNGMTIKWTKKQMMKAERYRRLTKSVHHMKKINWTFLVSKAEHEYFSFKRENLLLQMADSKSITRTKGNKMCISEQASMA